MKRIICFAFAIIMVLSLTAVTAFAKDYTAFNIVFEEKEGEKVNATEIKIFASVSDDKLVDRTGDFTMEDVAWFKYVSKPADGKTAEDYDYVDEELKIYGILCSEEDVFDHENFHYFLRIARLYAQEEDNFDRNVKINGVDIDEMNGSCYNTGSEFYVKTITNGFGGNSGEGDVTDDPAEPGKKPGKPSKEDEAEKDKCKVCGICPIQPLGICLFIWLAIILIVVIVVVILIAKGKKDKKKDGEKDEK